MPGQHFSPVMVALFVALIGFMLYRRYRRYRRHWRNRLIRFDHGHRATSSTC